MSELEKIYYHYQNDLAQGGDSEDVVKARDSLYNFLDNRQLAACDYEDFVGDPACTNERQGFLNGFKYAMKIALECMAAKAGDQA